MIGLQVTGGTVGDRLFNRLEKAAVTVLRASRDGAFRESLPLSPLEAALTSSRAFAAAFTAHWDQLQKTGGAIIDVWPGVRMVALGDVPGTANELDVALLTSREVVESEQFCLLCDEFQLDRTAAAKQMDGGTLRAGPEMDRTTMLVLAMIEDAGELKRQTRELRNLTSELSESYEELSLLYKLSCSMTVNQPRVDFIRETCRELRQVLGLEWLALTLVNEPDIMGDLSSQSFTAGLANRRLDIARELGQELIEHRYTHREMLVIEDANELPLAQAGKLTRSMLIVPLTCEGSALGVLFAGDKLDGSPVTSVDATLCSSLANGLAIYLQNSILYRDMESMFMGTLKALTAAIDAKDSYTLGHTERVAMLSRELALATGMDPELSERVYLSGLLHDVGKIGVPENVLTKPGKLTVEEFDMIKQHPEIGARILSGIRRMRDLIPGVLYHHERWDGNGYPAGIAGREIPLFGRIIALADAFDAMSSDRTYRRGLPHDQVLQQIQDCSGTQFDPELAEIFVALPFDQYFELAERHSKAEGKRCA